MTQLTKRLLIAAVILVLGGAGTAIKAGIALQVTNALGITGRSEPKAAAGNVSDSHRPAAAAKPGATAKPAGAAKPAAAATPGAIAKSGESAKGAPAPAGQAAKTPPIQASAGIGLASAGQATRAAKAPRSAPPAPIQADLTSQTAKNPQRTSAPPASGSAQVAATGAPRPGGPVAEPFIDPTERLSSWVREPYIYTSLGRRDPFGSLLSGEFVGDGEPGLVDVGNLKLVGIAWDQADRFAMVEDPRGFGYALREGDPVRSGKVLRINRTSVTFLQTMGGESNTITIELPMQEGKVR
jgi:hypothetical protein